MDKKIIRIPISYEQRKKNDKGEGYVPCQISGRYLNFSMESNVINDDEAIFVDVMTEDTKDDEDRLLTRMVIKKKDILEVLNKVKSK
ncbi:hypothetical protein [Clostridium cochlearium]|uniref:hypothetical protein n=1 Tax=Clostridium cochlearium TaxID=1494 RepID=UPI00180DCEAF|nr:hypothetical protein [Clostridium cochlearium]NMA58624.1 hypothetical protein [Clostridium cochlearium]